MKNSIVLMNSMYVLRFIVLTWVIMACSVLTHAQKECCIEMPHYVLKASASSIDSLYVQNLASEKIIQLGELRLRWRPFVEPLSTCDYELTWIGEQPAIRCVYRLPHSVPSSIHLTGLFVAFPDRIDVSYQLSGIPSGYIESWEGTQFRFRWLQTERGIAGKEVKLGLWKRNVEGGLPLEEFDCKIYPFYMDDKTICLAYDADNRANSNWIENEYRHTVLAKDGEHSYCTQYSILFASEEYPFEAISARWKGRPFALKLKSERVYNWWESTSDTIRLQAQVVNTSGEKKECVLNYWIRNYAGDLVNRNSIALSLAQMSKEEVTLEIVPETERELYFVEASVCDKQGEEIVFCRTNVGLLPPHQFKSSAAKSIMGLSAYWAIPDSANLKRLLHRMGVRWLRNGIADSFRGMEATFHNNINWKKKWKPDERDEAIRSFFRKMVQNGNHIWEFGNELNMSTPEIAGAGEGIGKALLAETYVEWLKAIRNIQQENEDWRKIKIISFGIAGFDEVFLRKLVKLGGWELLDGIALHPGRGNFTPDFPVYTPWTAFEKPETGYEYWNYYGSIKLAKEFIKRNGGKKDLYLTEIYALDYPNHSWNDTFHESAENVLLSYALAAAEGVKNALYYQLFNSVWFDQLGINPNNREYFFGLINQDLSFKPSFMAYCNAAEVLDEAVFKGWIKLGNDKDATFRGMLFDTPRGSMCVLWDRIEGYIQNHPNGDIFPEPWIGSWSKSVPIELPVGQTPVAVLNAIGQVEEISANHQQVITLQLTGAPIVVYGVDTSRLQLY